MKQFFLCLSLLMVCFSVYSQFTRIKVEGKVYYDAAHVRDTLDGRTMNEVTVLYYGSKGSLYRSYEALIGLAAFQKWRTSGYIGPNPGYGRGTKDLYYTDLTQKQVSRVRDFMVGGNLLNTKNYVMPEPIESFKWTIQPETKKIGNYTCQKATGTCRGRFFTAWFCNDIPYSFGPWKLSGLPGLIMEAVDSKSQVIFRFNRIEYPVSLDEFIEPITNSIVTKETEFERMREAYYDAPPGNSHATGIIRNAQGQEVHPKRPVINNPMDLISKLPTLVY